MSERCRRRVKLLSPGTFTHIRDIVSRDMLKWSAGAVCLDTEKRRMYVADTEVKDDSKVKDVVTEVKDGEFTSGRVLVLNI